MRIWNLQVPVLREEIILLNLAFLSVSFHSIKIWVPNWNFTCVFLIPLSFIVTVEVHIREYHETAFDAVRPSLNMLQGMDQIIYNRGYL